MKKKVALIVLGMFILLCGTAWSQVIPPKIYGTDKIVLGTPASLGVDSYGQDVKVSYCWGDSLFCDQWTDVYYRVEHWYQKPGVYSVFALFVTPWNELSAFSDPFYMTVNWDAPTIVGPCCGMIGELLSFEAQNLISDVEQRFDFGDGTVSGWCGPYCVFDHSYQSSGNYWIGVQSRLKDEQWNESDWFSWPVSIEGKKLFLESNVAEMIVGVKYQLKLSLRDEFGNPMEGKVWIYGGGHDEGVGFTGEATLPDFVANNAESIQLSVPEPPYGYEIPWETIMVEPADMLVKINVTGSHVKKLVVTVKHKLTKEPLDNVTVTINGAFFDVLHTGKDGKAETIFSGKGILYIDLSKDGYNPWSATKKVK